MRRLTGTRAILLLILVALLAGNIYLGVVYYQDRDSEDALADDIAAIEAQIATWERLHDISALEAELAALEEELAAVPFPPDVKHNIIHDYVMTAAEQAEAAFDSWETDEVATEETVNESGQEYRLFSYDATISGTLDEIFDFLGKMEANAPYDTIKLDDVELTYSSATLTWSISFTILVYALLE